MSNGFKPPEMPELTEQEKEDRIVAYNLFSLYKTGMEGADWRAHRDRRDLVHSLIEGAWPTLERMGFKDLEQAKHFNLLDRAGRTEYMMYYCIDSEGQKTTFTDWYVDFPLRKMYEKIYASSLSFDVINNSQGLYNTLFDKELNCLAGVEMEFAMILFHIKRPLHTDVEFKDTMKTLQSCIHFWVENLRKLKTNVGYFGVSIHETDEGVNIPKFQDFSNFMHYIVNGLKDEPVAQNMKFFDIRESRTRGCSNGELTWAFNLLLNVDSNINE